MARARMGVGVVAVLALAGMVSPAAAQEAPSDEVMVTYSTEAGLDRATADGGPLESADAGVDEVAPQVAVAELTPAEAADVADDPGVLAVEQPQRATAADLPNDDCYDTPGACAPAGAWHVDKIALPTAWDVSHGAGVVIAIVDGGVDELAPDLAGKVTEIRMTGKPECATHGTHGAALAAAATNNNLRIPGSGWDAQILSVQVMDDGPLPGEVDCGASESTVLAGITAAVDRGAHVVNLSLTVPFLSVALRNTIDSALARGAVVVAAAGNNNSSDPTVGNGGYPANYAPVLAVGATTVNDVRAGFSNFGPWVDVYAPGASLQDTQGFGTISGTSFAAPIVSGVVALIRSVRPYYTAAQIGSILIRSASVVNGLRRIDAGRALYDATFNASPAAGAGLVSIDPSILEVVTRGNDGTPWARTLGGPSTRWTPLSGGVLGDPDLASRAPGRVDMVVRGNDGAAWYRARVGTTWQGWFSLGGNFTSSLTVVSPEPGRLDVMGRGLDGALWHNTFIGASSTGWRSLGGNLTTEPDVASWAPGRLDVFAVGTDGGMWHRGFGDGTWAPWEPLGGGFSSGPGAVSWGPDRIDVVGRGHDGALWIKAWTGSAWTGWGSLGGTVASAPDLASRGPGKLDVLARAFDSRLWQRSFSGAWGSWFASS